MAATYTHPILKHSVLPKNIIMVGGLSQSFTYLYRLPLDGKTFTLNSRIQTSIQFHCYDNLVARRPRRIFHACELQFIFPSFQRIFILHNARLATTARDITGHPLNLFLLFSVFVHGLTMQPIPSAESQQPSG